MLNFVTFIELLVKPALFKISAEVFEDGDFLNIFLKFWGFQGSFSLIKRVIHLGKIFRHLVKNNSFGIDRDFIKSVKISTFSSLRILSLATIL